MTNESTDDPVTTSSAEAPVARRWKGIVIMMLGVLVALVTVLAVLFTIGRDVRAMRRELTDVAAPASAGLSELQRVLALEMAVQRGTGESLERAERQYRALLEEERAHFEHLEPLVAAVGPGAADELTQLRRQVARWHAAVERDTESAIARQSLSLERGTYAAALATAGRLNDSINARTAALRTRIAAGEQWESRLIVSMVLLAAICLAVLFRFAARLHDLVLSERRLAVVAKRRREQIEQVSRDKEMFIRGVAQDLKNPVGVIGAYAELLEMGIHGPLNAEQARVIARMRGAANQTLRIIEDLLRLARADAASLDLHMQQLSVVDLVTAVVEDYQPAAEREGVALELGDVPRDAQVHSDPARVREILDNLVTNAVRHTPAGGRIRVSVETPAPAPAAEPRFAIRVSDTGPGIPESLRADIFREFVRGVESNGSGIGLAISRRIARALGGDLVLVDAAGAGAAFDLLLPTDRQSTHGGS